MDAAFALGWLQGVGSGRWYNAFAQEKTQNNLLDQWMLGATPASLLHADDVNTSYLLVLGSNPRVSNRGHAPTDTLKAINRSAERTLVVVDPRRTETARGADVHLQVRPGGDCYLLLGMVAVILAEQREDWAYLKAHAEGLPQLQTALRDVRIGQTSGCG